MVVFVCLFQFCVVIVVVFVLEVIAGILAFFFINHVRQNLLQHMHQAMLTYQDNQKLRAAIDYIQKQVSRKTLKFSISITFFEEMLNYRIL